MLDRCRALRRNPQYLSARQMGALMDSIDRDGFLAPVLLREVDDGYEVLSGNHRVMAARELGRETVPAVVAVMDDAAAARVAVNLNTVHGDPTPELLAPFLAEMDDETLGQVHLGAALTADLKRFDVELREQLDSLEAVGRVDLASPTAPHPNCVCPTCGRKHIAPGLS